MKGELKIALSEIHWINDIFCHVTHTKDIREYLDYKPVNPDYKNYRQEKLHRKLFSYKKYLLLHHVYILNNCRNILYKFNLK